MEAIDLNLLSLFRSRRTPADQELKREVEAQLEVAKEKYEAVRKEGAPLPKIDWDIADPEVILRFQEGFAQMQEYSTKRRRTN